MTSVKTIIALVCLSLLAGCSHDPKAARDKYFNSAQKYFADAKYDEAAIQYRNALQQDKEHVASYLGLAQTLQKLGEHQNAIGLFQQVIKMDGRNVTARLQLGEYYLAAAVSNPELFKNAQEQAEEVLKIEPSNVEARILLGNALGGQKENDKSIRELGKALSADPGNLRASTSLGLALMRSGDAAGAERTFRDACVKYPDATKAHLALATFLAASKRFQEAESEYRFAFNLAPADPACLNPLVSFYLSTKRAGDAEKVLKEAISKKPDAREPRWGMALFYLQQGLTDKAIEALQEVLKASPGDRQALLRLAEIYLARNEDAKAEENIRLVLAAEANNAEAHYLRGKILLKRQDVDKALADFNMAIKLNDSMPAPYIDKANVLVARGDLEGAHNTLNAILERDRNNVMVRGALAKLLAIRQQPRDALQLATEVLAVMPGNEDAIAARAESLRSLGRLEEARKDFLTLCENRPDNPVYWHRLGVVEAQQQATASALVHLRKALELKPDFIAAATDIVELQLKARQPAAALAELDRWSRTKAPQDEVHRLRGQVYLSGGDLAAAESEFRKTVEVNPQNYQAYLLLAQLNVQRNNIPQALKEVDQLISRNNKLVAAHMLKGLYLQVSGDIPGAMASYRNALALEPDNPYVANNLAWLLCESGSNLDEALALAQLARKKLPDNPEAADTLGWIYYKQKNYILAVDQLLFAVNNRKQPSAEQYFHLGMAYYEKGDLQLARQTLRKALELDPKLPGAEEARKIIK